MDYETFREQTHDIAERDRNQARRAARRRHTAEFKTLDRVVVSKMDDKTLAEWQSEFESDEPQWRLAEHEWQRRLTEQSVRATISAARWQAWFGIFAVGIGALLALLIQSLSR